MVASLAILLGAELRFGFDLKVAQVGMGGAVLPRAIVFALWVIVGLVSVGMYRARQRPRFWETFARSTVAALIGGLAFVLFFYAFPVLITGRGVLLFAMFFCAVSLPLTRLWVLRFFDVSPVRRRVLVLGSGPAAGRIGALKRRSDQRRFEVVGFVPAGAQDRQYAEDEGFGPLISSVEEAVDQLHIDEIVVALDERRGMFPTRLLLEQKFHGTRVTEVVNFLERELEKIELSVMHPGWFIFEVSRHTNPLKNTLKRLFDIGISLVLLIIAAPIFLAVAISIWFEDGFSAPVFYRQERVGKSHSTFRLLKFRSMCVDAEAQGAQWSSEDDDRITRTGSFIRRTRCDELPQLINVLWGEMSIVGPRPERPEFVDQLSAAVPMYDYRHCVRPGITGWAQLNFPYGSSVLDAREKLKYDLYYIKNADIIFDVFVLLQTLEVVIWGRATSMAGPNTDDPGSNAEKDVRLFEKRRKQDAA